MTDHGLVIRPERPGDVDAIRGVHDAAFDEPDEGRIVDALRGSDNWLAALSLVAELDGAIVGHCVCSRAWLDAEPLAATAGELADARAVVATPVPILALGPIGVLPTAQRRGIGSRLVRASIAAAEAGGERLIVLLGHQSYYPRFGFQPARALGIEPPVAWPDAHWMALPLSGWARSGPGGRGRVRYPVAFEPL